MKVLFLEVTLERQDQAVIKKLETIKTALEIQPGFQDARLLENTQDPRVILLESTWKLEMPEVVEGFPIEGLKCRQWSFRLI
jgi:heme-degrading monooxygenase HmoA